MRMHGRAISAALLITAASLVLTGCSGSKDETTAPAQSVCSKFSLERGSTELWYDGGVILAAGVNGATVTYQVGNGPVTTVTASATRETVNFVRVITSYTATVNGQSCRWP